MVISLWILLPILCVRSFLSQLGAKSEDMEFRVLFHESLFGSESYIFKGRVPILIILLTPFSLWYIWTIIAYIWTVEFPIILHALQIYPAVFMFLQSFFQGYYLLRMFALPFFRVMHMEKLSFQSDVREYIYLNIVFTVHCICLTVITHKDIPGLYYLAIGEIAYRLLAIFSLLSLFHQTTAHESTVPELCTEDNATYLAPQFLSHQTTAHGSIVSELCTGNTTTYPAPPTPTTYPAPQLPSCQTTPTEVLVFPGSTVSEQYTENTAAQPLSLSQSTANENDFSSELIQYYTSTAHRK